MVWPRMPLTPVEGTSTMHHRLRPHDRAHPSLGPTLLPVATTRSAPGSPVVLWAALIFALSSSRTSGQASGTWDTVLRKLAHTAEYAHPRRAALSCRPQCARGRPARLRLRGHRRGASDLRFRAPRLAGRLADRLGRRRHRRRDRSPPLALTLAVAIDLDGASATRARCGTTSSPTQRAASTPSRRSIRPRSRRIAARRPTSSTLGGRRRRRLARRPRCGSPRTGRLSSSVPTETRPPHSERWPRPALGSASSRTLPSRWPASLSPTSVPRRRVELLEAGAGARERVLESSAPTATVASSRDDLVRISRDA